MPGHENRPGPPGSGAAAIERIVGECSNGSRMRVRACQPIAGISWGYCART